MYTKIEETETCSFVEQQSSSIYTWHDTTKAHIARCMSLQKVN